MKLLLVKFLISALLCLPMALFAQSRQPLITNDASNPLQIRSAELPAGDGRATPQQIVVENTGTDNVVAYVIAVKLALSNGRSLTNTITVDHKALGFATMAASIPPRSIVEVPRFGRSSSGISPGVTVQSVELVIVYAETAGGKVFGAEAKKYKENFSLQRQSRRAERARLKHMYQRSGLEALIGELQKE